VLARIYNIELKPGKGGQLARSAGSYAQIIGRDGGYAQVRLKSGELRAIHQNCLASIGAVSNPDTVTLTSINVDSCYILNSVADSIPLTVDSGSITVTPVDVSENHQVGPPVKIKNYMRYVSIEVSVEVAVKVYNPSGRLEKSVVLRPGSYSFKNLTPGIHFLIISGNHFSITRRILLIK